MVKYPLENFHRKCFYNVKDQFNPKWNINHDLPNNIEERSQTLHNLFIRKLFMGLYGNTELQHSPELIRMLRHFDKIFLSSIKTQIFTLLKKPEMCRLIFFFIHFDLFMVKFGCFERVTFAEPAFSLKDFLFKKIMKWVWKLQSTLHVMTASAKAVCRQLQRNIIAGFQSIHPSLQRWVHSSAQTIDAGLIDYWSVSDALVSTLSNPNPHNISSSIW